MASDNTKINLVRDGVWVGNTTRDPELRYTDSGKAICSAGMAVSNRYRDANGQWTDGEPTWLNLSIWEGPGENFAECIAKGTRIIVKGRLDQRTYTDKDGIQRTSLDVTVDEWGPSGRWATMTVTRTPREGGTNGSGPTAAPAPAGGDSYDEPF